MTQNKMHRLTLKQVESRERLIKKIEGKLDRAESILKSLLVDFGYQLDRDSKREIISLLNDLYKEG